jgi:hypothetical protein
MVDLGCSMGVDRDMRRRRKKRKIKKRKKDRERRAVDIAIHAES